MVSIEYLTSSSGLDNVFMFDISDYMSKPRKDREELDFYLKFFKKHNILSTCNTAGEEMIWSTCYKCNYKGIPFVKDGLLSLSDAAKRAELSTDEFRLKAGLL